MNRVGWSPVAGSNAGTIEYVRDGSTGLISSQRVLPGPLQSYRRELVVPLAASPAVLVVPGVCCSDWVHGDSGWIRPIYDAPSDVRQRRREAQTGSSSSQPGSGA